MTEAPLRLEGLTVARGGRPVVHEVTFEIPRGEVTALLGPNGAGKSTLVLAVAGVLRPLAGSIELGGRELRGRRPESIRQAGVAVVPEGRRLLSDLSVEDNLQVATYALTRAEAKTGRAYALELFPELTKRLDLAARSLSGGEQQMLVLAQALVSQPKFILIDELSLGLAPVVVGELMATVREINDDGVAVVIVEQSLNIAAQLCQRSIFLEKGAVRFEGRTADLLEQDDIARAVFFGAS